MLRLGHKIYFNIFGYWKLTMNAASTLHWLLSNVYNVWQTRMARSSVGVSLNVDSTQSMGAPEFLKQRGEPPRNSTIIWTSGICWSFIFVYCNETLIKENWLRFRGNGQRLTWSVTFLNITASWSLIVLRDFLTMSSQQQRLQWVLKKHLLESGLWHAFVHLRMALPILGHFKSSMLVALKAWQGLGNLYQGSWS